MDLDFLSAPLFIEMDLFSCSNLLNLAISCHDMVVYGRVSALDGDRAKSDLILSEPRFLSQIRALASHIHIHFDHILRI